MGVLSFTVVDHQTRNVVLNRRFDRFPVRIGRHEDNDVRLDYPFVSRWHAEVRQGPAGGYFLHALALHNGFTVAAARLEAGAAMPIAGRLIATLGTLELQIEEVDAPTGRAAPPAATASSKDAELPDLPALAVESAFKRGPAADAPDLPELPSDAHRHAGRRVRLQDTVAALRPLHKQFEVARRAWEDACMRTLLELRGAFDHEADDVRIVFREFPAADRPSIARDDEALGGLGDLGAVARAATELLPGLQVPAGEPEIRRFLARVVDVLRVFAACTLELHRVRARQSTDLGVRWEALPDPLAGLDTREEWLRYLLDWRDAGEARSEELVRSFAGLVDHLQCYAQAALSGAREVVFTLSPSEMERTVSASWPTRTAALWRHYEACFASLCGDTYDHLTPGFRTAFARAYTRALARVGIPFHASEPEDRP